MSASLPYRFEDLKPMREKDNNEYEPEQQQIQEYADFIGINLPEEEYMMELAKQGVTASLPKQWQACQTPDGELVYRNIVTKIIQEEHPFDEIYRQKVIQLRQAYEKYLEEQNDSREQLNTIPEEKSQQRSLCDKNDIEDFMMPSKELFERTPVLKEDNNSQLNQGMIIQSSDEMSLSNRETSKILPKFPSLKLDIENKSSKQQPHSQQTKYSNQQQQQKKTTILKLKSELESLKKRQKLAKELLNQLQKDNEQKTIKLKNILKIKSKKEINLKT